MKWKKEKDLAFGPWTFKFAFAFIKLKIVGSEPEVIAPWIGNQLSLPGKWTYAPEWRSSFTHSVKPRSAAILFFFLLNK